jgi:hypothetical protein
MVSNILIIPIQLKAAASSPPPATTTSSGNPGGFQGP